MTKYEWIDPDVMDKRVENIERGFNELANKFNDLLVALSREGIDGAMMINKMGTLPATKNE